MKTNHLWGQVSVFHSFFIFLFVFYIFFGAKLCILYSSHSTFKADKVPNGEKGNAIKSDGLREQDKNPKK